MFMYTLETGMSEKMIKNSSTKVFHSLIIE